MIKQRNIPKAVQNKLAEGNSSREDTRNADLLICTLTEAIHIHKKSGAEMCRLYCCPCLCEFILLWSYWSRRSCFLVVFHPSGSYTLFVSCSARNPEPWGEGFDGAILLRAECSKVSHSLGNVGCGIYTGSHLLQEETCLVLDEQGTDLWVYQNVFKCHFTLFFNSSIWFHCKTMGYLISGSWSPK